MLADRDKPEAAAIAGRLTKLGYRIFATAGTAAEVGEQGIAVVVVNKRTVIERIVAGEIRLVVNTRNTALAGGGSGDARRIDRAAMMKGVPVYSTIRAAAALSEAMALHQRGEASPPIRLQEL
jgi:carbamoyl-phosphate synthase large subunit